MRERRPRATAVRAVALAIVAVSATIGSLGCNGPGSTPAATDADAASTPSTGPSTASAPTASAELAASARTEHWNAALEAATRIPCRAIAVDGPVRLRVEPVGDAGAPLLSPQSQIPPDAWLTVLAGSRVVAKDPRTGRETTFLGPAEARACVAQREESWVAAGAFESVMGAGEAPGAEEWVITPLGVVRYIAAKIHVDVGVVSGGVSGLASQAPIAVTTTIGLTGGSAFLWYAADVHELHAMRAQPGATAPDVGRAADAGLSPATTAIDEDGWRRMSEGTLTVATDTAKRTQQGSFAAASASLDQCASLGRRARELAEALLAGHALDAGASGPGEGGVAKEQVLTRRLARAACAVAALRVARTGRSGGSAALTARLDEASAAWSPPALSSSSATVPAGSGAAPAGPSP